MSNLLDGAVAVVTSASSGIGRSIALRFAEEGAALVVAADITEDSREGAGPVVHQLHAAGARAEFVPCDVSRPADLICAVGRAVELAGRLDIMINNAGVIGRIDFLQETEDDYDRLMAVNVKGVFFGCQAAARAMAPRRSGAIINVSSVGGIGGSGGFVAYSASKGAVRLMTYSLGLRLGPLGIRVNALHPGGIDTQMNRVDTGSLSESGELLTPIPPVPLGRPGQPAEVGSAGVIWPAS